MKQQLIDEFRIFLEGRNYAPRTIYVYVIILEHFWNFCDQQLRFNPKFKKEKALSLWFKHITATRGATSQYNQNYSSLKLFYTYILQRNWVQFGIQRPRRCISRLPDIMSIADVGSLIENASNLKYRTIFLMLYATGMRIGELVKIKIEDISSQNSTIMVRRGKGRKDRLLPLPESLLEILRQYYIIYRPEIYLFNGYKKGVPLSIRTIQHDFILSKIKAQLKIKVSPHSLRHAFATHHLEDGTHLVAIKAMLGHSDFRTTSRYLQTSVKSLHQFNSPADSLCKKYTKPIA